MEELAKSLDAFSENCDPEVLDCANVRWTAYCVKNLRGDLLRKSMEISIAIAEFVAELKHPNH